MKRPGEIMSFLPQRVKDALLLLTFMGMLVSVSFQVKQNNLVNQRQHDSCVTRIQLAKQGNDSAHQRKLLAEATKIFVVTTRKVRNDKHSTSYDPWFVHVIDTKVTPRLNQVNPYSVPVPPIC